MKKINCGVLLTAMTHLSVTNLVPENDMPG